MVASVVSNLAVHWKTRSTLDDTLDVFPCHGVGGMIGMVMTGIFAKDVGLTSGKYETFLFHLLALVDRRGVRLRRLVAALQDHRLDHPAAGDRRAGDRRARPEPARRDPPWPPSCWAAFAPTAMGCFTRTAVNHLAESPRRAIHKILQWSEGWALLFELIKIDEIHHFAVMNRRDVDRL